MKTELFNPHSDLTFLENHVEFNNIPCLATYGIVCELNSKQMKYVSNPMSESELHTELSTHKLPQSFKGLSFIKHPTFDRERKIGTFYAFGCI